MSDALLRQPIKVLVIDDNVEFGIGVKMLLSKEGVEVRTATDGIEGLEMAKKILPDIVLLDVVMPRMDGIEVCRKIRQTPELTSVLIVMLSGLKTQTDQMADGLEAGADGYIARPVPNREFIARMRSFIRLKRTEKALYESEKRFRIAQEMSPDGFTILHPERNEKGEIVDFSWIYENQTVARINGTNPHEVIGKRLLELFPSHRGTPVYEAYLQVANTGISQILEDVYVGEIISKPSWLRLVVVSMGEDIAILNQDSTERKKAESALLVSEKKYRFLFENNPLTMWIYDLKTLQFLAVNQTAVLKYGYSEAEFLNMTIKDIRPQEDIPALLENIAEDTEAYQESSNWRHKTKQGEIILAEIISHSIEYAGQSARLVISNDITERKKAEKIRQLQYNIALATNTTRNLNELFDSFQKELNAIIDSKNLFIAIYNEATETVYSPIFKDEKDDFKEWPVDKTLTGYVIKQNRPVLLQKNEILRLNQEGIIELIGTTAEAWLGIPLKVEEKILGVVVIQNYETPNVYDQTSVEIMELVANELSLFIDRQRSEEKANKLSKAIEQSSVSILLTNREGAIEYVNPFFTELTGYSFEEVKGKNPKILKSGHQSAAFYRELWNTILSGNNWKGELLNKKKSGELYWEKAVISPIVNNKGLITDFVAIKEDITNRKKMLEELVEAKEKAQESDKLKTAFINNISHEIRTPLNGILGFGNLLLDEDISMEDKEEMLARVELSSNRLLNTVTDYMDMALLVSDAVKVNKNQFLVLPVVEKAIGKITPLCVNKNIEFATDFQLHNKDLILNSDPELISKILYILLDNALKFTTSGSITCGISLQAGFVEFFVKDTGKGIAAEKLDTIFKIFTQEDSSDVRGYEGSGLGLSIANGMVKLLGGTISAFSEKGIGSTFAFTVPCTATELVEKTPPAIEKKVPVARKPFVLISEDESSNYLFLETVLKKEGYQYLLAKTGAEAVALCKQHPDISLVLMDIKMPVMSGTEATKLIREFRPELAIIATTAFARTGDEKRFLDAGFNGYLVKPIKKRILLKLLESV